ncbi:hypothetical protein GCM10009841_24950 [Microlunatus panaciterrae]|uniref:LPXTG cell wall anchor domain-containing protein n=1 Tax=Microlunatus panaciterrae TaxID=400768 RepID=A0ABS2RFR0_9ACTN|nr:hypothetical protein [Microlunatus panaciterrae]MBM7797377.1 hypothetical protein [Microlunatus panaciterrae]
MLMLPLDVAAGPATLGPLLILLVLAILAVVTAIFLVRFLRRGRK